MKNFKWFLCLWPLFWASVPGVQVYKVFAYEINGKILEARRDCGTENRCFAIYNVRLFDALKEKDGSLGVVTIKVVAGNRKWPLNLEAGDIVRKVEWSNHYCINSVCRTEKVFWDLFQLVVSLLAVGVLIGWEVNKKSKRSLGEERNERNPG